MSDALIIIIIIIIIAISFQVALRHPLSLVYHISPLALSSTSPRSNIHASLCGDCCWVVLAIPIDRFPIKNENIELPRFARMVSLLVDSPTTYAPQVDCYPSPSLSYSTQLHPMRSIVQHLSLLTLN